VTFSYSRRLQFYETDAMGIIHHAIFVKLFEEARVELLRHHGLLQLEEINYPVLELDVKYKNPLYFDDEVTVLVRPSMAGARVFFEYEATTKRFPDPVAFGKTVHVAMDMKTRRPIKVPQAVADLLS